jgi:hypothetical protein
LNILATAHVVTENAMIVIERIADQPGASDNGAPRTITRSTSMVSSDPISDYMQRHGCGFPDALEALVAQLRATHRTGHQTRSGDAGPGRGAGGST